jgi:DNA repair ATPase RecN
MTPEEIQAALEAQLRINTETHQSIQAMSRDMAILVERQQATIEQQQATDERLDRLTNLTERYMNASSAVIERLDRSTEALTASNQRLDQSIEELKASNRRQERINDFLLRRETGGES